MKSNADKAKKMSPVDFLAQALNQDQAPFRVERLVREFQHMHKITDEAMNALITYAVKPEINFDPFFLNINASKLANENIRTYKEAKEFIKKELEKEASE